jgi:hypothetical protein
VGHTQHLQALRNALVVLFAAASLWSGDAHAAGWPQPVCARHAGWIATYAQKMLDQYRNANVYPADVQYLFFRNGVGRYEAHGCKPRTLGLALKAQLSPGERARLERLLPRQLERSVRRALAAAA